MKERDDAKAVLDYIQEKLKVEENMELTNMVFPSARNFQNRQEYDKGENLSQKQLLDYCKTDKDSRAKWQGQVEQNVEKCKIKTPFS